MERSNYTDDLDGQTLRDIGQLMASTSLIDHLLRYALGMRLGMDLKATRQTLGPVPWHAVLHDLRKNLEAAGIVIDGVDLRAFQKELDPLYELRDLVAHSIWVEAGGGNAMLARTRGGRSDGRGMRWEKPEGVEMSERLRRGARDAQFAAQEAHRIAHWLEEHAGRWAKPPETESDRGSFGMTVTPSAAGIWSKHVGTQEG